MPALDLVILKIWNGGLSNAGDRESADEGQPGVSFLSSHNEMGTHLHSRSTCLRMSRRVKRMKMNGMSWL